MRHGTTGASFLLAAMLATSSARGEDASPFEVSPFEAPFSIEDVEAEERTALATALADQGHAAMEERSWEEAARSLEVSYRLRPETEILLPLARALERIGQYAAAAERLARYLEVAELDQETRPALDQELREMRRHFARVEVETDPEGAQVSIDGRSLGLSPLGAPLFLEHGHYLLEARLEGYLDLARELSVAGGRNVEVLLNLDPIPTGERPTPRPAPSRVLEIAMWTLVGVAAASALALTISGGVAGNRLSSLESGYPDQSGVDGYESALNASYAFVGLTVAAGAGAGTLAIIRFLRGNGRGPE